MATHIHYDFDPTPQWIHKTLTKIEGRPTYAKLKVCYKELKSNLRQINSPAGGGLRGHLRLMYELPAYNALPGMAAHPWVDPVHPGPAPVIPNGSTTAQINRILADYSTQVNQVVIQQNTDKAALQLMMDAVDDTYYQILEDPEDGYADVRLITLVNHLTNTYGQVTNDDLSKNEQELHKKWSPSQPLEDLWKQCRDCQAFAADHDPITNPTLVRAASTNLEQSGVFDDALKKWRARPAAEQTWANFQTHFNTANKERLRSKTTGDFAAKAEETTSDTDNITKAVEAALAAALAGKNHPLLNKENMPEPMYYCWSHGLGHDANHTGFTCKSPQAGHKKEATQFNMMGGCNVIHRLKNEKRIWVPRWANKNGKNPNGTNNNSNNTGNGTNP